MSDINTKPLSGWYNYKLQEFEFLQEAPADYRDFIPQRPAAQLMFDIFLDTGDSQQDAALKVLKACHPSAV